MNLSRFARQEFEGWGGGKDEERQLGASDRT